MTGNETPFAARVAVVLKLPSTQHNSYRRGAPRGSSKRVRWRRFLWAATELGTSRAATLAHARPATTVTGNETPFAARVAVVLRVTKWPTQLATAVVRPGDAANACVGLDSSGRDMSGTRRAATLAQARPATTWLATKHLSLHVLLLFSNYQVPNTTRTAVARPGDPGKRVRWPGGRARRSGTTSCSQPCPGQTSDDVTGNETPFAARVAVVLKLPSTQHNSYRCGAPRGSSKRALEETMAGGLVVGGEETTAGGLFARLC